MPDLLIEAYILSQFNSIHVLNYSTQVMFSQVLHVEDTIDS